MPQLLDWDDLPHHEWECRWCGAANSDENAECQFCSGPPTQQDYNADHRIDERKHRD